MRLSNCLFVQNNMENNNQTNKLAKNIPHFSGEQSQSVTTPPGLARAYAGVKPLRFKGYLEDIKGVFRLAKKDPDNSPYCTAIKSVISNESEALCVFLHSLDSKGQRVVPEETLKSEHLYESTFITAKNAIAMAKLKAKSQASESANLMQVEEHLTSQLKEKLSEFFGQSKLPASASSSLPPRMAEAQSKPPASASPSEVKLKDIKRFLGGKRPENSQYYPDIKEVIKNEKEAICVWLHYAEPGRQRVVPKIRLQEANLHDSTLEVARKAIIKAKLKASESGELAAFTKVEDNLVPPLRAALGLSRRESLERGLHFNPPLPLRMSEAQSKPPVRDALGLPLHESFERGARSSHQNDENQSKRPRIN